MSEARLMMIPVDVLFIYLHMSAVWRCVGSYGIMPNPSWLANLIADMLTTTEHMDSSDGDGHSDHCWRCKDYSQ